MARSDSEGFNFGLLFAIFSVCAALGYVGAFVFFHQDAQELPIVIGVGAVHLLFLIVALVMLILGQRIAEDRSASGSFVLALIFGILLGVSLSYRFTDWYIWNAIFLGFCAVVGLYLFSAIAASGGGSRRLKIWLTSFVIVMTLAFALVGLGTILNWFDNRFVTNLLAKLIAGAILLGCGWLIIVLPHDRQAQPPKEKKPAGPSSEEDQLGEIDEPAAESEEAADVEVQVG